MEILRYELFFGLGVLVQLVFSIGSKFEKTDILKILGSIGLGLFATVKLAAKSKPAWTLEELLFSVVVISALCFGIFLKKKLLPEINELTLLCWNTIFWFTYASHFGFWNYLSLVLLIPTYISFVVIFFKLELSTFFQSALYGWFMVMLSYIGFAYFKFQNIFFYKEINANDTPIEMFLAGMVFLYIAVNIVNVLNFIPIPLSKHQTFTQRLQEVKEHAIFLAELYSDVQYNPYISFVVFIILLLMLGLNYYWHFMEEPTLITLCIVMFPTLGKKYQNYLNLKNQRVNIPQIKN